MKRFAVVKIKNKNETEQVARYLPTAYEVIYSDDEIVLIAGHDVAGWNLEEYIIPRLASGLYVCKELVLKND